MLSVRNTVADASHKVHIKVKMYNERDINVYNTYTMRLPYCLKHGKLDVMREFIVCAVLMHPYKQSTSQLWRLGYHRGVGRRMTGHGDAPTLKDMTYIYI